MIICISICVVIMILLLSTVIPNKRRINKYFDKRKQSKEIVEALNNKHSLRYVVNKYPHFFKLLKGKEDLLSRIQDIRETADESLWHLILRIIKQEYL